MTLKLNIYMQKHLNLELSLFISHYFYKKSIFIQNKLINFRLFDATAKKNKCKLLMKNFEMECSIH